MESEACFSPIRAPDAKPPTREATRPGPPRARRRRGVPGPRPARGRAAGRRDRGVSPGRGADGRGRVGRLAVCRRGRGPPPRRGRHASARTASSWRSASTMNCTSTLRPVCCTAIGLDPGLGQRVEPAPRDREPGEARADRADQRHLAHRTSAAGYSSRMSARPGAPLQRGLDVMRDRVGVRGLGHDPDVVPRQRARGSRRRSPSRRPCPARTPRRR